jgi:adenylate dimethylallyltransferase
MALSSVVFHEVTSLNSKRSIFAIIGPTGSGKTARAMPLAKKFNAPIIVADRVQCFLDISTTSAREMHENVNQYHYLSDRYITQGDYPPELAYRDLLQKIEVLSKIHNTLIIEGGSISIISRLASDSLPDIDLSVEILTMDSPDHHWCLLRNRAEKMLSPDNGDSSLLTELSQVWRIANQRPLIATVNGFEAVLSWCDRNAVDPLTLSEERLTVLQLSEIAADIATAHLDHALEQEATFLKLFSGNRRIVSLSVPRRKQQLAAFEENVQT